MTTHLSTGFCTEFAEKFDLTQGTQPNDVK
jgi:hypothetical protein